MRCECCKSEATDTHHLVFGRGLRDLADSDGLTIRLCRSCHTMGKYRIHDNPVAESLSKMLGQEMWEKNYISKFCDAEIKEKARAEFIKRYGRSYLEGE